MIRNRPQPKRNPIDGPYASRKKTYWPPARGHMAASSAQHSAPVIVSTPASAQAISNQPGEPTSRDDSADTMKIPEPIIEPTTIIVASSRLRPRMSLAAALGVASGMDRVDIVGAVTACQEKSALPLITSTALRPTTLGPRASRPLVTDWALL